MDRWAGRVAVVTGASSGIGEAIAKELVKQGMTVVGIARRLDQIQELAKTVRAEKGKLLAVKADISKENEILDAFTWIEKNTNGIDVLVNNAGVAELDSLLDGSTDAWKKVLDLNVVGLSICSREAVKSMKKKGADDGVIININSVAGHSILSHAFSMYSASKFAVRALSEALYKELAASGSRIRVTNLSPGAVSTEMLMKIVNALPSDNPLHDNSLVILQPSDIAQAVVFILSVESRVFIPELKIQHNFLLPS